MAETDRNERIFLYDNMRAALIVLVVIGHCIQLYYHQYPSFAHLFVFIYSFHMPAFIFLAGLFHKNDRILAKTVSYICIGFLMKAGFFLGNLLVTEVEPFRVFSEGAITWFMFVLAECTAASYILRNIDKRFLLLMGIIAGCFVGYDQTVDMRGFVYYPIYLLGQMCSKKKLAEISRRPALRAAGALLLAGWLAICFFQGKAVNSLERFMFSPYGDDLFPWGPALRILCHVIGLTASFSLLCVLPAGRLPVVTTIGERTLQIYFWHWPAARAINAVAGLGPLLCVSGPGRIAWILFAIAVAFITGTRLFCFPTEYVLYFTGARRKRPAFLPKTIEKTGLP